MVNFCRNTNELQKWSFLELTYFCTFCKRGFVQLPSVGQQKDHNLLHSHSLPLKAFHRCCFQMKKCFLKCPLSFLFQNVRAFGLQDFSPWLIQQPAKPLLDLPLSASSSVILGSFPVDTALFGRICPRDRRLCCFHSKYDPLHVTKGHWYSVLRKQKDAFLNRGCRLTGSLWIEKTNRLTKYRCYPTVTRH